MYRFSPRTEPTGGASWNFWISGYDEAAAVYPPVSAAARGAGKLAQSQKAGIYAPNPGGAQGTKIIIVDDSALIRRIGVVNANCKNRDWGGQGVSAEQPSIIDDLSIKSGFYDCPALGIVCVPSRPEGLGQRHWFRLCLRAEYGAGSL